MPSTGLILEPCTGDTVRQPVVVKVAYTTTTNFTLTCKVNTTSESLPQPHSSPPTSGTHISSGISPGAGAWTAFAVDTTGIVPTNLDSQPNVTVLGVGGVPPVIVGTGSGMMISNRKKRKPISGETIATAVYVVCLIYEIDSSLGTRTIIAAGAALVKHVGGKHKWSVPVKFKTKKPDNFQYVARVTAYDGTGVSLGTQTKLIKK